MALTTNLVSYWKLDGDSTDSVGTNTGTDTAISYSSGNGKINQGAGFNGTSSTIVGSAVNLTTSLTISCWVKTTQTPAVTNPLLFGFYTTGNVVVGLFLRNTNALARLLVEDSAATLAGINSGAAINDGNWHFLVGTLTSGAPSTIELWIDGVSQGTTTATFGGNFNGPTARMGQQATGLIFYSGAVDECAQWSRAITSTEIAQLYNSGSGLQYPFTSNTANPSFLLNFV